MLAKIPLPPVNETSFIIRYLVWYAVVLKGQTARFLVHMSLQGKRSVPSPGCHYRVVTDIALNVNVPRFLR